MSTVVALIENCRSLICTSSLHSIIFELMMLTLWTFLLDSHLSLSPFLFRLLDLFMCLFSIFFTLLLFLILLKAMSELRVMFILINPLFTFRNVQSSFDWFTDKLCEWEFILADKASNFRSESIEIN